MNTKERAKAEKLLEDLKARLDVMDSNISDLHALRAETNRHIRKLENLLKAEELK